MMHRTPDEVRTRDRSLASPHQHLMIFAIGSFPFSNADLTIRFLVMLILTPDRANLTDRYDRSLNRMVGHIGEVVEFV